MNEGNVAVGLSGFFMAKYAYANGAYSYTEGGAYFDAVSFQDEPQAQEGATTLPVNNVVKYGTSKNVSSVNLTVGTDGLSQAAKRFIIGIMPETIDIDGKQVSVMKYRNIVNPPYLGFGVIEEHKLSDDAGGAMLYLPKVFTKVKFSLTGSTINTRDPNNIAFQTKTVNAVAHADDSVDGIIWMEPAEMMEALASAVEFIEGFLGISAAG